LQQEPYTQQSENDDEDLPNEAGQQQPVFVVTYPAKSSISVPVGVSSDDFIKKEIE